MSNPKSETGLVEIPEEKAIPGYDMRPGIQESVLMKHKIGEYIWKMKLLDVFMDPNKSIYEKMRAYESFYLPNSVAESNLYSGGLFNDWNFDF
jgi:hypothetical protein